MKQAPFEEFKKVLQAMTPEYKQKLVENFKEFSRLKALCQAKGYIEILPKMVGIKVLKKKKEVKELKEVVDFLKPGGFKWLEKGVDLYAKPLRKMSKFKLRK